MSACTLIITVFQKVNCDIPVHVFSVHQFFFSEAYQRLSWEALKKSINGLVNKVSAKLYF